MRMNPLFRRSAGAVCAVLCAASAAAARADVIFLGNSRAIGMGGAGLAIIDGSGRNSLVNPASLALLDRKMHVSYPGIGFRASGIPLDKSFEHLFGNPDKNDALDLARDFGKRGSEFGLSLNIGARFGHLDAQASGVAKVLVVPNASLQDWAQNANGNLSLLTGSERGDIFGAAIYALPTVGVAERVSPKGSPVQIEAGARVKLMRAVYSHYVVSADNIRNNTAAASAPELNGGTTLTKDSVGVDFGLLVHPSQRQGLSGALVVTNLIAPAFQFDGTDANGGAFRYDLQPRTVALGSAWQGGKGLVAFDVVDITRSYGNVQARLGGEYRSRNWAFRTGYHSARGFTAGIGFGRFDIAFGNRTPLEVTQTLRF